MEGEPEWKVPRSRFMNIMRQVYSAGLGSENWCWRGLQSTLVDDGDCLSELSVFQASMDKPLVLSVIPLEKG